MKAVNEGLSYIESSVCRISKGLISAKFFAFYWFIQFIGGFVWFGWIVASEDEAIIGLDVSNKGANTNKWVWSGQWESCQDWVDVWIVLEDEVIVDQV